TLLSFKDYADGSHPGALVATENLPKDWPANPTPEQSVLHGEYEELAGHDAEARQLYTAALKMEPGYLRAHMALGRMEMRAGRVPQALEQYQAAVERDPWSGEARYGLGVALAAQGQHRLARAEFAHISPNSSRFALRDMAMGSADFALGDFSRAEIELRKAVEANPRDLAAHALLAGVLRRQVNFDAAGEALSRLEAIDPTSAVAAAERFLIAQARQAPANQESALLDALCASHPQQYLELAAFYARVSAWPEIVEILRAHVAAQDQHSKTLDPMVLYWLAFAETRTDGPVRARQTLGRIRAANRTPEIFPFRFEELRVLEEITSQNLQDDLAWQLLGALRASLGRRQEAVAAWKRAVDIKPNDRVTQRLLGFANHEWLGQPADARAHLNRAVELEPKDAEAIVALAESQAAAGSISEAIGTLKAALARLPASDALRAMLARLLVVHEEPDAALSVLQSKEFFIAESNAELVDLYRETKLSQGLLLLRKGQTTTGSAVLLEAGKLPATIAASDFERVLVPKLAYYQGLAHWLRGEGETARLLWQKTAQMVGLEGEDAYFQGRALDRLGQREQAKAIFDSLAAKSTREGESLRAQAHTHYL
ncbi:MAG: tetratricopeptide repeat protein, partial [Terriglobales bacterium]